MKNRYEDLIISHTSAEVLKRNVEALHGFPYIPKRKTRSGTWHQYIHQYTYRIDKSLYSPPLLALWDKISTLYKQRYQLVDWESLQTATKNALAHVTYRQQ